MTPARPHPLLTALLGLWLLFAMVEPVTWRPCPTHDGMTATPPGVVMHPGAMAEVMNGATMAMHPGAKAHHGAPHGDHRGHLCGCLETGCCAGVTAVPATYALTHWGIVVTDVRREVLAPREPAPAAADHVIPFANGPPALRAA